MSALTPVNTRQPKRYCSPHLSVTENKLIKNVYEYFKILDENTQDENSGIAFVQTSRKRNIPAIVARIMGIGESTVRRQLLDQNQAKKPKKQTKKPKRDIEDFEKCAIRNLIYRYCEEGTYFTLSILLKEVNEKILQGNVIRRTTLLKILTDIGFKFKKCDNNRVRLMEQKSIVTQRIDYLKKKNEYEKKNANFIFLDETWINKNHHPSAAWTDGNLKSLRNIKIGKGQRLIITHGGGKDGFVEDALDIFWSNSGKADYHQDMNAEYFEKWYVDKFLPALREPSVIVMDNARYHSRRDIASLLGVDSIPTSNSKKDEMQTWLTVNNISFPKNATKKQLYPLVKANKPFKINYWIDQVTWEHGHEVLRLPPYHCIFNPIELIWANTKGYVAKHNLKQDGKTDVKELFVNACNTITVNDWVNAMEHCKKEEQKYWVKDGLAHMRVIEPIIINVNTGDSDDSDEVNGTQSDIESD